MRVVWWRERPTRDAECFQCRGPVDRGEYVVRSRFVFKERGPSWRWYHDVCFMELSRMLKPGIVKHRDRGRPAKVDKAAPS